MAPSGFGDDFRSKESSRGTQGWPGRWVKVILISAAVIAGFFGPVLGSWEGPIFVAVTVLVLAVLYWRDLWRQAWFWITIVLLTTVQVPLVIVMRPLIEQARMFYMGTFLAADSVFVIIAITLVSRVQRKG